jgi:hypothetical protein
MSRYMQAWQFDFETHFGQRWASQVYWFRRKMNLAEIIEELPKLTAEGRQAIYRQIEELRVGGAERLF